MTGACGFQQNSEYATLANLIYNRGVIIMTAALENSLVFQKSFKSLNGYQRAKRLK